MITNIKYEPLDNESKPSIFKEWTVLAENPNELKSLDFVLIPPQHYTVDDVYKAYGSYAKKYFDFDSSRLSFKYFIYDYEAYGISCISPKSYHYIMNDYASTYMVEAYLIISCLCYELYERYEEEYYNTHPLKRYFKSIQNFFGAL